jgi:DNA-binding Lrp family transcriptional regulator
MKIDEINRGIIEQLRNGRKSFDEISKELSITPNTMKARVKILKKLTIIFWQLLVLN